MQARLYFLFKHMDHICWVALALVGGAFGCADAGIAGAVAGSIFGFCLGGFVGSIATSILVLVFGRKATLPPIPEGSDNPPPETALERTGSFLFRTFELAFFIVLLHEFCESANPTAIAVNNNTGAFLTQATSRGDSREYLRDGLKGRRWQHEIVSARPVRWFLADEPNAMNQANLEFIDFVNGKGVEKPGSGLNDTLKVKMITALWRSEHWAAQALTDKALNSYGNGLCHMCQQEMPKYVGKGWILRYMPKAWFQGT